MINLKTLNLDLNIHRPNEVINFSFVDLMKFRAENRRLRKVLKNRKFIRKTILAFTFVKILLLTSCDFTDDKLKIVNETKDSIAFIIPTEPNYFATFEDSQESSFNKQLNDSLLNVVAKYDPKDESFGGVHFLEGDSAKHLHSFNSRWEQIINQTSDKKLKILFFPANVMTSGQYKWKDIYENKLFKEKTFTSDELDKINWTIKYGK